MLCRPPRSPGTYALLLRVTLWHAVRVDARGRLVAVLRPGLYAYVGSAWGPGGLAARIERHLGLRRKRLWWHIDRVLASEYVSVEGVVYAPGCRGESLLAERLSRFAEPVPGVGSSDDPRAPSHLYLLPRDAGAERLALLMEMVCGSRVQRCTSASTGGPQPPGA